VRITGRVQGVGFRASAHARARSLGIGGFARNRPDGSVDAAFEGPRDRVESMLDWARRGGPLPAEVREVEVEWEPPAGDTSFRVS